jgi:hypothetical protein
MKAMVREAPSSRRSPVSATVDFNANGLQHG